MQRELGEGCEWRDEISKWGARCLIHKSVAKCCSSSREREDVDETSDGKGNLLPPEAACGRWSNRDGVDAVTDWRHCTLCHSSSSQVHTPTQKESREGEEGCHTGYDTDCDPPCTIRVVPVYRLEPSRGELPTWSLLQGSERPHLPSPPNRRCSPAGGVVQFSSS